MTDENIHDFVEYETEQSSTTDVVAAVGVTALSEHAKEIIERCSDGWEYDLSKELRS